MQGPRQGSPRAGLMENERRGECGCCVAECDHKKRTLCGGREEGHQGRVKRHVWRATRVLFVYQDWIACACIFVSYFAYICVLCTHMYMFDLVARLLAPGSLEGEIIKGMSGYKMTRSSAHSSFVCLFVRLYSLFTPSYVSSRLVNQPGPMKHHRLLHLRSPSSTSYTY